MGDLDQVLAALVAVLLRGESDGLVSDAYLRRYAALLPDGSKLKVLQVREKEGLWIIQTIFQAGYEVQTHKHTGPVWGYTVSGAWKYKEYDYVNRAGSFLYEPAGSVHTLTCIEDNTQVWFHMYGCNLNLDKNGNVESVSDEI